MVAPVSTVVIDKATGYMNVDTSKNSYRVINVLMPACPNPVGGGAGQNVTVPFTGLTLPAVYSVFVTPGQKAAPSVQNKTSTGFNVVLSPILAAETIAAGTFDVQIVYQQPNP